MLYFLIVVQSLSFGPNKRLNDEITSWKKSKWNKGEKKERKNNDFMRPQEGARALGIFFAGDIFVTKLKKLRLL